MSSLNLSFKEWPFFSLNQITQNHALKTHSLSTGEIEIMKSNAPIRLASSIDFSNAHLLQRNINLFQINDNFNDNKSSLNNISNKQQYHHLSSWGRCELFSTTNEGCLSIFANDYQGCLTPIFMFSPFEKYSIGKISKQPSKDAYITAIGWADGHLQPTISKPILAISSDKGNLLVYDFRSNKIIGKLQFNETIISICWSSFKLNRFYAGTSTGHLYICELYKKSIQIVKTFDFYTNSIKASENVLKSVDFIIQDDIDGFNLVIASKDGSIGFITNLNEPKQAKLQVFQNFNFIGTNKDSNVTINYIEYYPNNQDFIIIGTDNSTFLISISKGLLIPFIQTSNCKFISLIDNENDKIIVGDDNEITVWKLVDQKWVRSFVTNIGGKYGFTENLTFSKHKNKILLTTASNWLTEVEYRRNRVFVSKRIKLMSGMPIDYDFGDGSIAFLTRNNSISFTSVTPESVCRPKFAEKRQDLSDDVLQDSHASDDSNNDDYSEAPLITSIETERYNSTTFEISSSDTFKPIPLNEIQSTELTCNNSARGNSNSFSLSFNIQITEKDTMIKHIKWISSSRVVAWCKNSLNLIDLQKHEVTEPLKKKFDKKCIIITQVFFSKSYKFMGIILNHKQAHILDTRSNLKIINSIDFTHIIKKDCAYIYGGISYDEDKIVFASHNFLLFSNLKDKLSLKQIHSNLEFNPSFVSWKNHGVYIGTERGSAFLIRRKKLDEICASTEMSKKDVKVIFDSFHSNQKKLGRIKMISSCGNRRYVLLDSNKQGVIVSNTIETIADNIKIFKQSSKGTFLIHFKNYNKLIAFDSLGDFQPSPPPCYYLNPCFKSQKNSLIESFKDFKNNNNLLNSITRQLFLTDETNQSISLRNSVNLLHQIISLHDTFSSLSSKTFLKLGHLEKARNILLHTDPANKEYFNNMMLAAIYNSNENDQDSIHLVVKNLLENNLIDEAVDIFLITKDIYAAAEILFKYGRNKDAYQVLMLNENRKETNISKELVQKIAISLISKKENVLFGLKLLSSYGYINEMIKQLSLNLL